jgi:hypothetical protein
VGAFRAISMRKIGSFPAGTSLQIKDHSPAPPHEAKPATCLPPPDRIDFTPQSSLRQSSMPTHPTTPQNLQRCSISFETSLKSHASLESSAPDLGDDCNFRTILRVILLFSVRHQSLSRNHLSFLIAHSSSILIMLRFGRSR